MSTLVLGSNSPRRQQLLRELGFQFVVRSPNIEEIIPFIIPLTSAAEYLAVKKNQAIQTTPNEVALTADTVVICSNESLAKPANGEEARDMLQKLSDGIHEVITGVCIASADRMCSFSATTRVKFRKILPDEIDLYISRFEPFDKAGAYGIQEWIGLSAISRIEGSYTNVVGLPTEKVYDHLVNIFDFRPFENH